MINEILKKINYYKTKETNRSWTKNTNLINYSNSYLTVLRVDSSNRWTGVPHKSEIEKMWSIVFSAHKDFRYLPTYQELKKYIDIRVTPVTKGEFKGYPAIRIYKMRQEPTQMIIKDILDYIFQ